MLGPLSPCRTQNRLRPCGPSGRARDASFSVRDALGVRFPWIERLPPSGCPLCSRGPDSRAVRPVTHPHLFLGVPCLEGWMMRQKFGSWGCLRDGAVAKTLPPGTQEAQASWDRTSALLRPLPLRCWPCVIHTSQPGHPDGFLRTGITTLASLPELQGSQEEVQAAVKVDRGSVCLPNSLGRWGRGSSRARPPPCRLTVQS